MAKTEYIKNFINGRLQAPFSETYIDGYNPATGSVFYKTPDSDERDVDYAVEAAQKALPQWSNTPTDLRSRILFRIADIIEQNLDMLAVAETEDNGKPITLARTIDIPRAAANFRFFAGAIAQFGSESHYMEKTALNYTLRQPIGVVGCISPWNLPLYLFTWKIAPALATGNCVIAKPSEVTPRTAYLLSQICTEGGLPAGVLNIVHGYGGKVGNAMVKHPAIKAISFTGGTKTGREIAKTAAPMFKKVSLEMGGKNPNIVFADCDFPKMLSTTVRAAFSNQGQICLAGSRIYVQRPIYEKFKTEFIAKSYLLKVGDPMEESTSIGAVVSKPHLEKILYYIDLAQQEGGTVLVGGKQVQPRGRCKDGWFVSPTIIEGLPIDCRTNQEEIFGPVVTITPFDTEDEVVKYANNTEYGLSATVWTNDLNRAHRVAHRIESGIVWVNCWMVRDLRTPFGGTKNSGLGREGGTEALRFFTEPKNVCVRI